MNDAEELLEVIDRAIGQARTVTGLVGDSRARKLLQELSLARDFISDVIEENESLKKVVNVQMSTLDTYRELVEHRNRQIIALGGEP